MGWKLFSSDWCHSFECNNDETESRRFEKERTTKARFPVPLFVDLTHFFVSVDWWTGTQRTFISELEMRLNYQKKKENWCFNKRKWEHRKSLMLYFMRTFIIYLRTKNFLVVYVNKPVLDFQCKTMRRFFKQPQ